MHRIAQGQQDQDHWMVALRARLVGHAPFGHWQTQAFIAALHHDRLDAPWVIDGPINRDVFDRYTETQLAPTLQKGDVLRRKNDPPDHFRILLIPQSRSPDL